jgi:hypothetical protein
MTTLIKTKMNRLSHEMAEDMDNLHSKRAEFEQKTILIKRIKQEQETLTSDAPNPNHTIMAISGPLPLEASDKYKTIVIE